MKSNFQKYQEFLSKLKPENEVFMESVEKAFSIIFEEQFSTLLTDYEIISHGVDGEQYFPGCGTGHYKEVVTGIGDNEKEAFDDALEQIAINHKVDLSQIEKEGEKASTKIDPRITHEESDMHFYVSIRYNLPWQSLGSYTEAHDSHTAVDNIDEDVHEEDEDNCEKCGQPLSNGNCLSCDKEHKRIKNLKRNY